MKQNNKIYAFSLCGNKKNLDLLQALFSIWANILNLIWFEPILEYMSIS